MSDCLAVMAFLLLCIGIAVAHAKSNVEFQVCMNDGQILIGRSNEVELLRKDIDLSEYTCETRKGTHGEFINLRSRLRRAQGR